MNTKEFIFAFAFFCIGCTTLVIDIFYYHSIKKAEEQMRILFEETPCGMKLDGWVCKDDMGGITTLLPDDKRNSFIGVRNNTCMGWWEWRARYRDRRESVAIEEEYQWTTPRVPDPEPRETP